MYHPVSIDGQIYTSSERRMSITGLPRNYILRGKTFNYMLEINISKDSSQIIFGVLRCDF